MIAQLLPTPLDPAGRQLGHALINWTESLNLLPRILKTKSYQDRWLPWRKENSPWNHTKWCCLYVTCTHTPNYNSQFFLNKKGIYSVKLILDYSFTHNMHFSNSFLPQLGYLNLMPAISTSLITFCLFHCVLAPLHWFQAFIKSSKYKFNNVVSVWHSYLIFVNFGHYLTL